MLRKSKVQLFANVLLLTLALALRVNAELPDGQRATLMIDVKIGKIRDGEFMQSVGIGKLLESLKKSPFLPPGMDLAKTQRIILITNLPDDKAEFDKPTTGDMPLDFLARVEFKSPADVQEIWTSMQDGMTPIEVSGKKYLSTREQSSGFNNVAGHLVNGNTLEVGTERYVFHPTRLLLNQRLTKSWRTIPDHGLRVAFDMESERALLNTFAKDAKGKLPAPLVGLLSLLKVSQLALLSIDADSPNLMVLSATGADDAATKQLEDGLGGLVALVKIAGGQSLDEIQDPDQKNAASAVVNSMRAQRDKNRVTISIPRPRGLDVVAKGGLASLQKFLDNPFGGAVGSPPLADTGSIDLPHEEKTPDFGEKYGQFTVTKFSDGAEAAMKAHLAATRFKSIRIGEGAGDRELQEVCRVGGFTEIEIKGKAITTLAPLAKATGLKQVRLDVGYDHEPLDIAPLSSLVDLEEFDSYATKVANVNALAGCTKLEKVNLYMAAADSLDFAVQLPELREMGLYGPQHTFADYSPLLKCPKIEILDIYMNPQAVDEKVGVLSALTNLKEIRMSNNKQQTNLDFVANSDGIENINAMWCSKLTDVSALAGKKKLRTLVLASTPIDSIADLAECESLSRLNISETQVTDLSPLAGLTNLSSLKIGGLAVEDYSALKDFTNLRSLYIGKDGDESKFAYLKETNAGLRIEKR